MEYSPSIYWIGWNLEVVNAYFILQGMVISKCFCKVSHTNSFNYLERIEMRENFLQEIFTFTNLRDGLEIELVLISYKC